MDDKEREEKKELEEEETMEEVCNAFLEFLKNDEEFQEVLASALENARENNYGEGVDYLELEWKKRRKLEWKKEKELEWEKEKELEWEKIKEFWNDGRKLYKEIKKLSKSGEVGELIKILEQSSIKTILNLNPELKILSLLFRIIAEVNWALKKKELEVWKIEGVATDLDELLKIFTDELAKLDYTFASLVYDKLTNLLEKVIDRINDKVLDRIIQEANKRREELKKEDEQRGNKEKIKILLTRKDMENIKIPTKDFKKIQEALYELETDLLNIFLKIVN